MDQSIMDLANDTQMVIEAEESTWEPDVRKKLLDELSTPQKVAEGGSGLLPGQDHMKVFLRVRPFTSDEEERNENQGCVKILSDSYMTVQAPKDSNTYKNSMHGCAKQNHRFTFSKIFPEDTTQKHFFDETVLGIVKDFIDGQNCLIFTYGVTNSGKTYTIQGNPKDGGILPRALDVVFNSIEDKHWNDMSLKPKMFGDVMRLTPSQVEREQSIKDKVFKMAVNPDEPDMTCLLGDSDASRLTVNSTMSEDSLMMPAPSTSRSTSSIGSRSDLTTIDEEKAFAAQVMSDIESRVREETAVSVASQEKMRFSVWVSFAEVYNEQIFDLLEPMPKKKTQKRTVMQLREDKHGVPYVKGTKEINVTSADEAYKVLTIGRQNLQFADTKLNHNSSRSHCIFTVKILRMVDMDSPHVARVSMLSFCDLAGAERSNKTMSRGDRMKEAGNINTSLLSLGRCIKVLRHNQMYRDNPQIVPFRDSKLTRIFQSFFCGKGKAAMIVNINQCASMFDETLHALKYSAVAKQVVVVQEAPKEKKLPAVRSHRLVSLALSEKASRATIGWATPGTLAKLNELENEAVNVPIPDADDEEDDYFAEREKELLEVIESMKVDLISEKKHTVALEMKIRAEVCDEMAKQIVEIENSYSHMLKEEKILAEERAEKRIEMYMHSVKKSQKRKRIFEDEDEGGEMVPSVFLQQEQNKVKALEDAVSELRAELQEVKEQLSSIVVERDSLQQQHTELTFQLADMRSAQGRSGEGDLLHSEVVQTLRAQIQSLKEDMQEKDKENTELNEMLTEAGETFQGNEAKIDQLQSMLCDYETKFKLQEESLCELQKVTEDSGRAIEEANSRLMSKQEVIAELESRLESAQECGECQGLTMRMTEVIEKLADAESELDKKTAEIERVLAAANQKGDEADILKREVSRKRESLCRREDEVSSLRNMLEAQESGKATKESQVLELLNQIKSLEDQHKQDVDVIAERDSLMEKLNTSISEYKTALADHETFVAELNKQIKKKESEVVDMEAGMKASQETVEQFKKQIEESASKIEELMSSEKSISEEKAKLAEELSKQASEIAMRTQHSQDLEEKVDMLEQTLQQANASMRETALEAAQLREKLDASKSSDAATSEKSHAEVEAAQQIAATLQQDLKQLQAKLAEHEDCDNTIKSLQDQLDDYIFKVNEQAITIGDLQDQMKETSSGDSDKQKQSMKDKIKELEDRLSRERNQHRGAHGEINDLLQSKSIEIEELNSQVNDLRKQVEMNQKALEQAVAKQQELEAAHQGLAKLEKESLKQTSDASSDSETSETEAQLRTRIRELENVACEAEYKAQMGTRQVRREKSQVERRLKEVEEELETAYTRCKSLEEKMRQMKQQGSGDESGDEESGDESKDWEEERSRLEGLVKELEAKLESASADTKLSQKQSNDYQQMETDLNREKDTVKELRSQLEEGAHRQESLQKVIEEHIASITQLKQELRDSQASLSDANQAHEGEHKKSQQVAALQEQIQVLRSDLEAATKEGQEQSKNARNLQKKLQNAEENLSKCMSTLELQENKNKKLQEDLDNKDQQLHESTKSTENMHTKCESLQVELKELWSKLNSKTEEILSLEDKLNAHKEQSGKQSASHGQLTEEIRELKSSKESLMSQVSELKASIESTNKQSAEREAKLAKKSESNKQFRSEIIELKSCKETLESELREVKTSLDKKCRDVLDNERQVKSLEENIDSQKTEIGSLQSRLKEFEAVQVRLKEKEDALKDALKELECLKKTREELKSELSGREASIESNNQQMAAHKEEIITLNQQIAKLSGAESALRDTVTALRGELETKDTRLGRMEDEISKKTNAAAEQKALQTELEKSCERESKLRKQLQEASQRQEEQNVKFNIFEERLKVSTELVEKHQTSLKESRQEYNLLKEELNDVRRQLKDAQGADRTHAEALASKEAEISRLQEDLEKKEARLKQRSTNVKDLMSQIEQERNGYELALKDAKVNERIIESMKAAMDEQEATMVTQDKVLQSREEQIRQMETDHAEQINRFETLLNSNRDQSSQMKEIQARCKELQAKLSSAEKAQFEEREKLETSQRDMEIKIREHRRKAERAEHDRNRFEQDIQDTNRELRTVEKKLAERESAIADLKAKQTAMAKEHTIAEETARIAEDKDSKLSMLKVKFQKLEEQNKELDNRAKKQHEELESFAANKQKEMEKWRENRDKLVGQLQQILAEKDAKLAALTNAQPVVVKSEDAQPEIEKLKQELADKDETIAQLSSHLEEGNTTRARRGGRPRLGSDSTEGLRKEVENLYRQLEAERMGHREQMNRAVRAKDQIITDLKQSNHQLQNTLSEDVKVEPVEIKVENHPPGAPSQKNDPTEEKAAAKRRATRGPGRKRKTSEAESENTATEETPSRKRTSQASRGRSSHKRSAQMQVSFSENNADFMSIQEEDVVDLDQPQVTTSTPKPRTRTALADTLNTSGTDGTFVSPEKPSTHHKKKHRLRTKNSEPFRDSPVITADNSGKGQDAHAIVTRKLRSRKKTSQV